MPESIFVNEKEIKIKSVYITDFGVRPIGRESDEKTAIKTGVDERIFFYVPDTIFERSDDVIAKCVLENIE